MEEKYGTDKKTDSGLERDLPAWVVAEADSDKEAISKLLDFSDANYARQIDWYHHHKVFAIKNIAGVLAAEVTIIGLSKVDGFHPGFIGSMLGFLGLAAVLLAWSGNGSCTTSYKAAMEHLVVVNKCLWAMGFAGPVAVSAVGNLGPAPVREDRMLYVARHMDWLSTEHCMLAEVVQSQIKALDSTLSRTRWVLWVFGLMGLAVGFAGCWIFAASI